MRLIGRTIALPLALVLTAASAIALTAGRHTLNAASSALEATPHATPTTAAHELHRIHAHFDSVLRELGTRDVSLLPTGAAANRDRLMQTLTAYNARGVFPHNYDFPDTPTPYFVDRRTGTLCAVAFLLESTGRRDIVNRVAASNNNVWVPQLAQDSAFTSWLDAQGITLAEAARIQVPYMDGGTNSGNSSPNSVAIGVYLVGAPLAMSSALATGTWNAWGNRNGHNRFGNYAGIASGLLATGFGSVMLAQQENSQGLRNIGAGTIVLGTVSIGLATRAILHRPRYLAAERARDNVRRANFEASLSPIIPLGQNSGAGMSMIIRF